MYANSGFAACIRRACPLFFTRSTEANGYGYLRLFAYISGFSSLAGYFNPPKKFFYANALSTRRATGGLGAIAPRRGGCRRDKHSVHGAAQGGDFPPQQKRMRLSGCIYFSLPIK
jgi:hypothetical protein